MLWLVQVPWNPEVDMCWHSLIDGASEECEPVWCDSEDPLFILYTSGSTGKPKVLPPDNNSSGSISMTNVFEPIKQTKWWGVGTNSLVVTASTYSSEVFMATLVRFPARAPLAIFPLSLLPTISCQYCSIH